MKESTIRRLLEKAEELRVVYFLEEVMEFVQEIKPVLANINSTVSENLTKMPVATKKLSKVTEATEVATTEILNIVDGLFIKTDGISKALSQISGDANKVHVDSANSLLDEINNDSSSIMMALQVQDITSQQIAAVNHLLETMRSKLISIVNNFEFEQIKELMADKNEGAVQTSTLHREIAFDPDAINAITEKKDRQEQVNRILDAAQSANLDDLVTNDDIDALFSALESNSDQSEELPQSFSEENETSADDQFSQDDIDALFGN